MTLQKPALASCLCTARWVKHGHERECSDRAFRILTQALPGNTQVYGELVGRAARSGQATVAMLPAKAIQEQLAHHRDNYLLHGAQHYLQGLGGDKDQARRSMELAVRCSASNPIAWANLSKCQGARGMAAGHGRAAKGEIELAKGSRQVDESCRLR
jgi:hypothetical protein